MDGALAVLSRSLKPGGVFYASFRYGEGEGVRDDGRYFTDCTEDAFREQLRGCPELGLLGLWRDRDAHRPDIVWLGALMRKQAVSPAR
jgi:hypothetical protein